MPPGLIFLYVLISIIVITTIILLIIYRDEIFGNNYGTYSEIMSTGCITENGKCNEIGFVTTYQDCIVNPKTKKGCLNEDNKESLKRKEINVTACSPACRVSIWKDIKISECINGEKTITKECVSNDAYGINTCTYEISNNNGSLQNYIPEGCLSDGNIVTCNVGSFYTKIELCEKEKSKEILDSKIENECIVNDVIYTPLCRSFDTLNYMTDDINLLNEGWIDTPFNLTLESEITEFEDIKLNLENGDPSITLINGKYTCNQPCFYFDEIQGEWDEAILRLIGDFNFLIKDKLFLSLWNIPCKMGEKMLKKLGNCRGDPFSLFERTECLMLNLKNEDTLKINGLLLTVKPTRHFTNKNYIYCNILSIFSKNFKGYLSLENEKLYLDQNIKSEFLIEYLGENRYNIRTSNNQEINVKTINNENINLDNVYLRGGNYLNGNIFDFDSFNNLLLKRSVGVNKLFK